MTRRVLLKLSGEALMGTADFGIQSETLQRFVDEIALAHSQGIQIGIVVGGGNLFRGVQGTAGGMQRSSADYMGMMATIMNVLALADGFRQKGHNVRSFCSIEMPRVMDLFSYRAVMSAFKEGAICLFAGGTGSPYFTTDTGAALKAAEIEATELLKATQALGIYEADPRSNPQARLYRQVSFQTCLSHRLQVMDQAAFALCQSEGIPIRVFSLQIQNALTQALLGDEIGTRVDVECPSLFVVPSS
jgi:uridylate kinase